MARQITKYLDSRGKEYDREEDADRADGRYAAEKVLDHCCDDDSARLEPLEGMNREALQPLYDYIGRLMRESDERTKRFG